MPRSVQSGPAVSLMPTRRNGARKCQCCWIRSQVQGNRGALRRLPAQAREHPRRSPTAHFYRDAGSNDQRYVSGPGRGAVRASRAQVESVVNQKTQGSLKQRLGGEASPPFNLVGLSCRTSPVALSQALRFVSSAALGLNARYINMQRTHPLQ
jgi:hypothetical protein